MIIKTYSDFITIEDGGAEVLTIDLEEPHVMVPATIPQRLSARKAQVLGQALMHGAILVQRLIRGFSVDEATCEYTVSDLRPGFRRETIVSLAVSRSPLQDMWMNGVVHRQAPRTQYRSVAYQPRSRKYR